MVSAGLPGIIAPTGDTPEDQLVVTKGGVGDFENIDDHLQDEQQDETEMGVDEDNDYEGDVKTVISEEIQSEGEHTDDYDHDSEDDLSNFGSQPQSHPSYTMSKSEGDSPLVIQGNI